MLTTQAKFTRDSIRTHTDLEVPLKITGEENTDTQKPVLGIEGINSGLGKKLELA